MLPDSLNFNQSLDNAQIGNAIPAASTRAPPAPSCTHAGTRRRPPGAPCARLDGHRPALAQDARQGRLAHLDRLAPQVRPVSAPTGGTLAARSADVEGTGRWPGPVRQHTTSPSIRHNRTLRWFTASANQRIALRPVVAPAGDQPDAYRIAPGQQPETVVLDLVNPVGAGRGLAGWGWEAGSMKLARSAGTSAYAYARSTYR